jgi:hypothetical protein
MTQMGTDRKYRNNLTVAVQFLPHAGGDKWARRAATPYLFPQLPSVQIAAGRHALPFLKSTSRTMRVATCAPVDFETNVHFFTRDS